MASSLKLTLLASLAVIIFTTTSARNVDVVSEEYELEDSEENFTDEEYDDEYNEYDLEDEDVFRKKKKNQTDNKPVSQVNANVGAGTITIPIGNNSDTANQGALNALPTGTR